ncbi:hypothetical protein [Sphingomonas sp. LB2R24]
MLTARDTVLDGKEATLDRDRTVTVQKRIALPALIRPEDHKIIPTD